MAYLFFLHFLLSTPLPVPLHLPISLSLSFFVKMEYIILVTDMRNTPFENPEDSLELELSSCEMAGVNAGN